MKIGSATILMLKASEGEGDDLVFKNGMGGSAGRSTAANLWADARELLPFIGDGWHQLRHHHASLLIASGLSPVAVAHSLGHKDATATLQTYAHLWPNDDDRMVAATDGILTLETPVEPLYEKTA